tara:strand:+ start:188 stop:535 length:348 start_codon:yes stop_codon:yes gene_type:complete
MTIQNFPSGTCRGARPGGLETGLRTGPKSLILKGFFFFRRGMHEMHGRYAYKALYSPPKFAIIYIHSLIEVLEMGRREKAKLARILHRAAAILVGSIFGLITGAGIALWMDVLAV